MESLQKAVDRARSVKPDYRDNRRRDSSIENADINDEFSDSVLSNIADLTSPEFSASGSGSPQAGSAKSTSSIVAPLHDLQYTQTRRVECNIQTLLKNRVLCDAQPDTVLAPYRLLRTQVLQTMRENKWNSIAVVSANEGEGRTLTAVNLAIAIAKEVNHTVLLADFDLQHPSISQYFGFDVSMGVSDYIYEGVTLDKILVNPGTERLVILPGRGAIRNTSETLISPTMVQLTQELKNRYASRMVIFDLPALLTKDDAIAFSPYVDAFLMVFEEGKTSRADIVKASSLIGNKPVLGTVLNKG